ncbi:MAG TPA: DUF2934 domain-containing protein [Burkholderiales bacterium]|nr:DUF2934 domain-containing protein [Burkholderiales bacterium]
MADSNRTSNDHQNTAQSPVPAQWGLRQPRESHSADPIFVPQPPREHEIRWPGNADDLSPAEISRLISATAYSLAARRGYHDGYDIEDWLGAEAEVNARLEEIRRAARVGTPAG